MEFRETDDFSRSTNMPRAGAELTPAVHSDEAVRRHRGGAQEKHREGENVQV